MGVKIHINSLTFGYDHESLLFEGINALVIPTAPSPGRGFVTVIMGESGCGKTTLLRLLLGEEIPFQGSISMVPMDIRVSYLSQDPILFEHLSVEENARYFSQLRSTRPQFDEEVYMRASQELGLSTILKRASSVMQLSGGERQRIALLRALSIRPSLLLLDEPCRGLDIPVRQEFLLYLRQLTDELGLAVVYVTHQQSEARLLADRILFLVRTPATKSSRIVEGSLFDLTSLPQHDSIALTFSEGPMNHVDAMLLGNQLELLGKTYLFANTEHFQSVPNGEVSLLFRASQVKWNLNGGIPCYGAIRTGQFLVASVDESETETTIVIGPCVEAEVRSFDVHGKVFLFGKDGELLSNGELVEG